MSKNIKLDWFFLDMFLELAQAKGKVRLQKKQSVFSYNGQSYTVTFTRGDILNKKQRSLK